MNTEEQAVDVDADLSPEEKHAAKQAREALAHTHKAPIDQSFGRPNARPNTALPPTPFDMPEPWTVVSQTLDPGQIRAHDQFELQQAYGVTPAVEAMELLHKSASDLLTAREALKGDVTQTPAAQVLAVEALHTQLSERVLAKVDQATKGLDAAIATAETTLRKAITDGANSPFASEIRAMCRSLPVSERTSFLTTAITNNDGAALSAILGAPSYLSGLDAKLTAPLTERVNRLRNPALAARHELMVHAREKLQEAAGTWLRSGDAMVGARSVTVERLKAGKNKIKSAIGAIAPVA